jgi:hypothetical protein
MYWQDSWKVKPNLTLLFGARARYQFNGVPYEGDNNFSTVSALKSRSRIFLAYCPATLGYNSSLVPSYRNAKRPDTLQGSLELIDIRKNQSQKAVLLCEIARVRCLEAKQSIEKSKRLVDESRKLCNGSPEVRKDHHAA